MCKTMVTLLRGLEQPGFPTGVRRHLKPSVKKRQGQTLPQESCFERDLLFVGLSLFGGNRCKRAEQAVGLVVWTGGEEQDRRRARSGIVAEP